MKAEHEIIKESCFKKSANFITYIGLVCTIGIPVTAILDPKRLWLMTIFAILSGVSDLLDGIIARKLKTESLFGSALDRLRDKVFIIPSLIILIWIYRDSILVMYLPTVILVCSTIFIESLLFIIAWIVVLRKIETKANKFGQIKMFILFPVMVIWLISLAIQTSFGFPVMKFSIYFIDAMFIISGFLSILSMEQYHNDYFKKTHKEEGPEEES